MADKAVFLDRDGTVVDDPGYLADPAKLKLLSGVDLAIKSLRQAGYRIVLVTNQSGVARGKLTEATLKALHDRLNTLLTEKGAPLDAVYHCPYHPEGTVPEFTRDSDLRKPAPGMLLKAAGDLDLDLRRSWMVGDAARDTQAGLSAGCRTVLLDAGKPDHEPDAPCDHRARNLVEAARIILRAGEPEASPPEPPPASRDNPAEARVLPTPEPELSPPTDTPSTEPIPPAATAVRPGTPKPPAGEEEDENARVRKEILMHVRQLVRSSETEEFHLTHVLGGVAQVMVGLLLLLVLKQALMDNNTQAALLWAVVAVVFQTMSLTFFLMARNKH